MPSVNLFLMNPLNWLSFISESRSEGESFDTSLVLPLTVGLGTVVVSVLLGFKSNLLSNSNRKLPSDHNIANSIRESVKRKSSKSNIRSKLNITSTCELKPAPKAYTSVHETISSETVTPVAVSVISSEAPTPPHQSDSATFAFDDPSVATDEVHTSTCFQPTPHFVSEDSKPSIVRKKSKKSRRSHRSDGSQANSSEGISSEADHSWVTVIPKKSKHSIGISLPDTLTSQTDQTVSGALDNSKTEENEASLSASSVTVVSSPNQSECLSAPNMTSQSNPTGSVLNPTIHSVTFVECPTNSVSTADQHSTSQHATINRMTSDIDHNREAQLSKYEAMQSVTPLASVPVDSHAQAVPDDLISPQYQSSSSLMKDTPLTLKPLALYAQLPATSKLLAQHLSAQVQAKEAECQLLRSEVIYLREEVERALGTSKLHCVDVDTMTDLNEPEIETTSAPNTCEPTNADEDHDHRSDSPDTVLLRTLQNEIARLAKEVTLSHQRNENLETRLNTTKSQLAVAKKKTSRDTKAIRQQLEVETERATTAEQNVQELETKLQDALQQLATQREQFEESERVSTQQLERVRLNYADLLTQKERWEQQQTVLQNEQDQLTREYEVLRTKHAACLVDLDSVRYESENLRTMLHDTESRLDTLKRDHAASLIETQTHATQLEAQLAATQEKHLDAQSRLSAAESSIVRLTTELDASLTRLTRVTGELDASRATCLALEQRLLNEQDNHQRTRGVDAETIQTHPNSPTTPFLAEARAFLDETTQTDLEPAVEFEMQSDVTQSTQLVPPYEADDRHKELELQVVHYKSALDMAEAMLSKLQTSVEEEERRWRGALESSTAECELLRSKVLKLESSLSNLFEERDQLNETLNELQHQRIPIATDGDPHTTTTTTDDCASDIHYVSLSDLIDSLDYDETTPKPELIRMLNRLRYFVQTEHDALVDEQANRCRPQAQLRTGSIDDGAACDISPHPGALDTSTKWPANGPHKLITTDAVELDEVGIEADLTVGVDASSSNGRSHEATPSQSVIPTTLATPISNGLQSH